MEPRRRTSPPARLSLSGILFLAAALAASAADGSDWPQWRGPNRDNTSPETGLALNWKATPPTELWRVNVGRAMASPVVANGKVYVTGCDLQQGEDAVWCLDAETGAILWRYAFPSDLSAEYGKGSAFWYPEWAGTHATPAVEGGRLYEMSIDGKALCLDAATGKRLWHRDAAVEDKFAEPSWGHSSSPLVLDKWVIFGGGLALDKMTGALASKALGQVGASSPVPFVNDGRDCVMVELAGNIFSAFTLPDFTPFWRLSAGKGGEDDIDPVVMGDRVLFSHQNGAAALAKIGADKTDVHWTGLKNGYDTPILYKGFFYSTGGYLGRWLQCYDPKDGAIKWKSDAKGGGYNPTFCILADGKLIVQHNSGLVEIVVATPESYQPLGTYDIRSKQPVCFSDSAWKTPALSHGRLYCRTDLGEVVALDVRANRPPAPAPSAPVEGRVPKWVRADQNMAGPVSADDWCGKGQNRGRVVRADRDAQNQPVPAFRPAAPGDWPQWRGPNRDGVSSEEELSLDWTARQPKTLWRVDVGMGYSAPVVAGDRVYAAGWYADATYAGATRGSFNRCYHNFIGCLDARTGQTLWKYTYLPYAFGWVMDVDRDGRHRFTDMGPRATPLLDGTRLYLLDQAGDALCLDAATGAEVWRKSLPKVLDLGTLPAWFYSGSPLALDKAVVFAAGTAGVALDKGTGETLWSTGKAVIGNASPIVFAEQGRRELAVFGKDRLFALDADTGKTSWSFPWADGHGGNFCDAVAAGADRLVVCGGYGKGAALLAIGADQPLWKQKALDPRMGAPVLHGGCLYGPSQSEGFVCVDAGDGSVKWREKMDATQVTLAGDRLLIQCRGGEVWVAEATPAGFRPLGKVVALDSGECWTPPVVAGGRLYDRSWDGELVALDLAALEPLPAIEPVTVTDERVTQLGAARAAEREAAVAQLSRMPVTALPKWVPVLADKASRGTWFDRESACRVLNALGPAAKAGAPVLAGAARESIAARDWAAAGLSVEALAAVDPAAVTPLVEPVKAALADADSLVARGALDLPVGMGAAGGQVVEAVAALLNGADRSVAGLAVLTLGRMGPNAKGGVPALIEALGKGDLRAAAIEALRAMGPPAEAAVAPLVATSTRVDVNMRKAIENALRAIKTRDAPPAVKDATAMCVEGKSVRVRLPFADADDTADAIAVSVTDAPAHGTVLPATAGEVEYHAAWGYAGKDTFTWTAADETASSAPASVIVEVAADTNAPAVLSVVAQTNAAGVVVTFSKPLDKALAEQVGNYQVEPGVTVEKATLDEEGTSVSLATSKLAGSETGTLTVANLHDRSARAVALPRASVAFPLHP